MKDKDLDAVRLALQRIQHIASAPENESNTPDGTGAEEEQAEYASRFSTSGEQAVQKAPLRLPAAIFAGVLIAAGAGGFAAWQLTGQNAQLAVREEMGGTVAPQGAPAPQPVKAEPSTVAALTPDVAAEAQSLLEAGRVREARQSLIDVPQKSPELALTLARSYDPNYLRLIPNADAAADAAEAERWYRTWRDIASARGFVMEPERFDRIIKAMR